jgi:hypothetical protein
MQPGWFPDPSGRFPLRWFDGSQWTPQVLDGWQRPATDPLPASSSPADPPTTPLAESAPPRAEAAPATAPVKTGPKPLTVTRYVTIGVAAMLMLLGLFVLPWISVYDGKDWNGQTYPKIANALSKYTGGTTLNWWQHLYLEWFAVGLAIAVLAAVAITVFVVGTKLPYHPPRWALLVCVASFGLMLATFAAIPDFPAAVHVKTTFSGPGSVAAGYLLLALACPTPAHWNK